MPIKVITIQKKKYNLEFTPWFNNQSVIDSALKSYRKHEDPYKKLKTVYTAEEVDIMLTNQAQSLKNEFSSELNNSVQAIQNSMRDFINDVRNDRNLKEQIIQSVLERIKEKSN